MSAVGAVHRRLEEAGLGDPGLEVVADDLARHSAEGRQRVDMRGNPVRQRLARGGFGVDEARGAEHGDEDLGTLDLAGRRVDHLHGVTGEVDEQPLARDVHLAQRRLQPTDPLAIQIAEPGIAEPVGGRRAVFLPQQRQCHVRPTHLAMHGRPIRNRPLIRRHVRLWRKQQRLEPRVVQVVRQRPRQTGSARPAQVIADRTLAQPQAMTNNALRQLMAPIAAAEPRVSFASTISRQASRPLAPRQKIDTTLG